MIEYTICFKWCKPLIKCIKILGFIFTFDLSSILIVKSEFFMDAQLITDNMSQIIMITHKIGLNIILIWMNFHIQISALTLKITFLNLTSEAKESLRFHKKGNI